VIKLQTREVKEKIRSHAHPLSTQTKEMHSGSVARSRVHFDIPHTHNKGKAEQQNNSMNTHQMQSQGTDTAKAQRALVSTRWKKEKARGSSR
jgi:hypothetical protein